MSKPLITFAMLVYNQESFVHEAIKGALAQTYSPLEIIISDDCSPDDSSKIIEQMVADYHGPHRVIVNRNPINLGLSQHVNQLFESASGEWVILSAGDDISKPDRVSTIFDSVQKSDSSVFACFSDAILMDQQGRTDNRKLANYSEQQIYELETIAFNRGGIGAGATYGYRREVYTEFGPMSKLVLAEDRILPLRAGILGGVLQIPTALVNYRQSESSLSSKAVDSLTSNLHRPDDFADAFYDQQYRDLKKGLSNSHIDDATYQEICDVIASSRQFTIAKAHSRHRSPLRRLLGIAQLFPMFLRPPGKLSRNETGRAILGAFGAGWVASKIRNWKTDSSS